jgi:hypothetical protein
MRRIREKGNNLAGTTVVDRARFIPGFWFEYFAWFAVSNMAVGSRIVLIEIGVHWTKLGA